MVGWLRQLRRSCRETEQAGLGAGGQTGVVEVHKMADNHDWDLEEARRRGSADGTLVDHNMDSLGMTAVALWPTLHQVRTTYSRCRCIILGDKREINIYNSHVCQDFILFDSAHFHPPMSSTFFNWLRSPAAREYFFSTRHFPSFSCF